MKLGLALTKLLGLGRISLAPVCVFALACIVVLAPYTFAQTSPPATTEDAGALVGTSMPATPGTPSALLSGSSRAAISAGQVDVEMTPGTAYTLHCQDGDATVSQVDPSTVNSDCALWTPTPTAQPTATPVPVATATATAVPATATPVSGGTVNGVPLCDGQNGRPAHDWMKWHPLVERDASGNVICTYGHEHGMDPSLGDSVFGPLPLADEISYPWATVSATGVAENGILNKHRVYKWLVDTNMGCATNRSPDGSSKMVTAMREEAHADGNLGAAVRFHSFWGQYQLTDCTTGDKATMTIGGHMDYATLHAGMTVVPLSNDPPASCILNGDRRQEGALGGAEQASSVWYGANSRASNGSPVCDDYYGNGAHVSVQLNVGTDGWGPVDPNNPTALNFYPNRSNHDGTQINSDALTIWISGFVTDTTGHINFTGHVDRHGLVVPEVAGKAEGPDYIPLVIKNAKSRAYGSLLNSKPATYNGDVPGPNGQLGYYVQLPM